MSKKISSLRKIITILSCFRNLQMGIEWSLLHCKYEYVMLSADNSYLHIPNIYTYLRNQNIVPKNQLYAGIYRDPVQLAQV